MSNRSSEDDFGFGFATGFGFGFATGFGFAFATGLGLVAVFVAFAAVFFVVSGLGAIVGAGTVGFHAESGGTVGVDGAVVGVGAVAAAVGVVVVGAGAVAVGVVAGSSVSDAARGGGAGTRASLVDVSSSPSSLAM